MTQRKKLKRNVTKRKRHYQKGGLLIMNSKQDLINTHLCAVKMGKQKETTGQEVYTYNGDIYQLNTLTLGFLQQEFKKSNGKWFKFVIFNNDGEYYIYIINGGQVNKHSVCMLLGLLDVTNVKNEYTELRNAVNQLIHFKMNVSPLDIFSNISLKEQLDVLINNIDSLIERDIACMPVSGAGSGTINDDNSICINNKSGHYKPSKDSMKLAQTIFMENTKATVYITDKVDKELLQAKYGDEYENYTGICL